MKPVLIQCRWRTVRLFGPWYHRALSGVTRCRRMTRTGWCASHQGYTTALNPHWQQKEA